MHHDRDQLGRIAYAGYPIHPHRRSSCSLRYGGRRSCAVIHIPGSGANQMSGRRQTSELAYFPRTLRISSCWRLLPQTPYMRLLEATDSLPPPIYTSAAAAPTSASHIVGDVIWSTAPAACSCTGWVALTTGSWTAGTDYKVQPIQSSTGVARRRHSVRRSEGRSSSPSTRTGAGPTRSGGAARMSPDEIAGDPG